MNQINTKHRVDVADLLSPVNQPMADVANVRQETSPPVSWFTKWAEASYEGWRRNGSQSYI